MGDRQVRRTEPVDGRPHHHASGGYGGHTRGQGGDANGHFLSTTDPYDRDEGKEGPPETECHAVGEHLVARAFGGTRKTKSPGPDGMGRWRSRAFMSETPTE